MRKEIIRIEIQLRYPKQRVHKEDQERNPESRRKRQQIILIFRLIKPERAEREASEHNHPVCPVIADHSRKKNAVMLKTDSRKRKRKSRAERSHEEAEALQNPLPRKRRNRDKNHIDVAKLKRQFAPPDKLSGSGFRRNPREVSVS